VRRGPTSLGTLFLEKGFQHIPLKAKRKSERKKEPQKFLGKSSAGMKKILSPRGFATQEEKDFRGGGSKGGKG